MAAFPPGERMRAGHATVKGRRGESKGALGKGLDDDE